MSQVYRVHQETTGEFHIVLPNGNFARTTEGGFFATTDLEKAKEALAYLTQSVEVGKKRVGAHWLKSTFGVL